MTVNWGQSQGLSTGADAAGFNFSVPPGPYATRTIALMAHARGMMPPDARLRHVAEYEQRDQHGRGHDASRSLTPLWGPLSGRSARLAGRTISELKMLERFSSAAGVPRPNRRPD